MAFRVGVTGLPNTGKSFSWTFYDRGEEVFAICPSSKLLHVRKSDGTLLQPLDIEVEGLGKSLKEIMKAKNEKHEANVLVGLANSPNDLKIKTTGDYIVCSNVKMVAGIKKFVDRYMPHKKIILNPDFTHYISYIMQDPTFIARKAGGEAFQRFWELAADTLGNTILSADSLKNVVLDVTEFHSVYNESLGQFEIYTPGGKMLTEKFLPDSYFDLMSYSYVLPYEQEKDESKRFKFMTIKRDGYEGRSMGLFSDIAKDGIIDNNIKLVIDRLFKYLGK